MIHGYNLKKIPGKKQHLVLFNSLSSTVGRRKIPKHISISILCSLSGTWRAEIGFFSSLLSDCRSETDCSAYSSAPPRVPDLEALTKKNNDVESLFKGFVSQSRLYFIISFSFFHFSTGHFGWGISPFPARWQPGLIFQFNTVGNIGAGFFFLFTLRNIISSPSKPCWEILHLSIMFYWLSSSASYRLDSFCIILKGFV